MDPILLACAIACLPMPSDFSVIPEPSGLITIDGPFGVGHPAGLGDSVTIQFFVQDTGGETIADSARRGLPYSFRIGDKGNDSLLEMVTRGMRPGGHRTTYIPANLVYDGKGVPNIVGAKQNLIVTIDCLPRG